MISETIKLSSSAKEEVAIYPNQIKYLLIVSYITQNTKVFKQHHKNPKFYDEVITKINEWLEMSDEDIQNKFKSLPYKV